MLRLDSPLPVSILASLHQVPTRFPGSTSASNYLAVYILILPVSALVKFNW